jgi:hypothetical protein
MLQAQAIVDHDQQNDYLVGDYLPLGLSCASARYLARPPVDSARQEGKMGISAVDGDERMV